MRAGEYIRSLRSPVFTGAIQISILLTYLLEDAVEDVIDCLKEAKAENQQLRQELNVETKNLENLKIYSKRYNLIINELPPSSYAEATASPSQASPVFAESSADTEKAVFQLVNEALNRSITSSFCCASSPEAIRTQYRQRI